MSDTPEITLGTKKYPIAKLAPRQQRIVLPAIMRLLTPMRDVEKFMREMTEAQYDDLLNLVFIACTKAQPMLKKDDFLNDDGITLVQLINATIPIMQQAGMREGAPGETKAADPSSQTGTG